MYARTLTITKDGGCSFHPALHYTRFELVAGALTIAQAASFFVPESLANTVWALCPGGV